MKINDQADSTVKSEFPVILGYKRIKEKKNLLSWSWAENQLNDSKNYWLCTISRSLIPHIMPVWGIWFENNFYFSTSDLSKKARNLSEMKNCSVSTEYPNNPLILEGTGKKINNLDLLRKICEKYNQKYNWSFKVKNGETVDEFGNKGPFFEVKPKKLIGWIEFPKSMTKWTFQD